MEQVGFLIQAVTIIVALILLCSQWRAKPNSHRIKWRLAPEPSGALPILGHLLLLGRQEETLVRTLGAMADRYGPAFMLRLGVHRTLVVSNWEMVKDCFTINDRIFATRSLRAAGKLFGYDYASVVFSPYGPYWGSRSTSRSQDMCG